MSEPSARSVQPQVCLAMKPKELVITMSMEKNLVCSKRENWRVCRLRISGEVLLCLL